MPRQNGTTCLQKACIFNRIGVVQTLLANGANVNVIANVNLSNLSQSLLIFTTGLSQDGCSPLYYACLSNHNRMVLILLASGADISVTVVSCNDKYFVVYFLTYFHMFRMVFRFCMSHARRVTTIQSKLSYRMERTSTKL